MGNNSKIEWTDYTWNVTRGCSRDSTGCENCYAEGFARRFHGEGKPYEGLIARNGQWNGNIALVPHLLLEPLKMKQPKRIFVNSTSDLFHHNITDHYIDLVFAVMARCPQHTFQILTKRADRMREYMLNAEARVREQVQRDDVETAKNVIWPLTNVHLGVSIENQPMANKRVMDLIKTPAAVRWLSVEPMLGLIHIWRLTEPDPNEKGGAEVYPLWGTYTQNEDDWDAPGKIDWVVCGGESTGGQPGKVARPLHPEWVRYLREQCLRDNVPFFFKQWGDWNPIAPLYSDMGETVQADHIKKLVSLLDVYAVDGSGKLWDLSQCTTEFPPKDAWVIENIGKKKSGRTLDGMTWEQFPTQLEAIA